MGSRGRSGPHLPGGELGPGESCQPVALGGSARVQTRPRTLILEPAPPEAPSRPARPFTRPTSPRQPGGEGKQRGREDRGPARARERLVATQQVFCPRDRGGVKGPELVTEALRAGRWAEGVAFFWSQLNCPNFKRADPKDSPTVTNYISSPFTLCLPLHPGLFTICNYAFVLF